MLIAVVQTIVIFCNLCTQKVSQLWRNFAIVAWLVHLDNNVTWKIFTLIIMSLGQCCRLDNNVTWTIISLWQCSLGQYQLRQKSTWTKIATPGFWLQSLSCMIVILRKRIQLQSSAKLLNEKLFHLKEINLTYNILNIKL